MTSDKQKLDQLQSELGDPATDPIGSAINNAAARAHATVSDAQKVVQGRVDALSTQVRQQPFLMLSLGVVAGFLIGRLLR